MFLGAPRLAFLACHFRTSSDAPRPAAPRERRDGAGSERHRAGRRVPVTTETPGRRVPREGAAFARCRHCSPRPGRAAGVGAEPGPVPRPASASPCVAAR